MFLKFTSRRNGLNSSWNRQVFIGVTFDETQSPFARANGRRSLVVEVECYIAVGEGIHYIFCACELIFCGITALEVQGPGVLLAGFGVLFIREMAHESCRCSSSCASS